MFNSNKNWEYKRAVSGLIEIASTAINTAIACTPDKEYLNKDELQFKIDLDNYRFGLNELFARLNRM